MNSLKIAVIVPTIRPELLKQSFLPAWRDLFQKHEVSLCIVKDGEEPNVQIEYYDREIGEYTSEYQALTVAELAPIYNFTDACRNLGFYVAKREIDPDIYISLDDDVLPVGDPIQDHIDALSKTVKLDWVNTSTTHRMRGLPYNLEEYPVWLSHGTWQGVPDLDAIQQLQYPDMRNVDCPQIKIPKGVFFPLCAMNFAFRKELLPWAYQAPMGQKLAQDGLPVYDRFADIWSGIVMKYALDMLDAAAVSGFATVNHVRASNVFVNLRKEAVGMEVNENIWKKIHFLFDGFREHGENTGGDETMNYLKLYYKRLNQWQELIEDAE